MDQMQIQELISQKMKLIRVEYGYTQNRMAEIIGLSKKTLVQIEKQRTTAGWTTVTAVCALFRESEIIRRVLGDAPLEILETAAHLHIYAGDKATSSLPVTWTVITEKGSLKLERNERSGHFRISRAGTRLFSTWNRVEAELHLEKIARET
ncbi:transcriptional regulator [Halobacillus kuroshimensis]|uniref:Transcriptional regulator n=1 Tax=Halobacillus kuroshimensis TaxID=302481 RepID=A0ABS3DTS1_9BACI|nr:helix-turn-helix domain-containing protein [Halobacillus kuroshimensis]MBN8234731.1 transcriptional regulator [Halobacillus kuroshimensis]